MATEGELLEGRTMKMVWREHEGWPSFRAGSSLPFVATGSLRTLLQAYLYLYPVDAVFCAWHAFFI
jgi:hypothetical protein